MRLGAIVLQTRPWKELAEDFRRIEEVGYDIAYVADPEAGSIRRVSVNDATVTTLLDRDAGLTKPKEVWAELVEMRRRLVRPPARRPAPPARWR